MQIFSYNCKNSVTLKMLQRKSGQAFNFRPDRFAALKFTIAHPCHFLNHLNSQVNQTL
jgi:hypothetical protein